MRRQRRLGADDAAPAFQAFQQRGLLAADVGAGADADFEIECLLRTADGFAKQAAGPRRLDRAFHRRDRVRIFRADIDEAFARADRERCYRHAFDQDEGIALHDHAVGEGAAVAFVGIADDVFLRDPALRQPCAI